MSNKGKPRVKFCWECGRKLRGNHFEEVKIPYQEHKVIMHKQCAKEWERKLSDPYDYTY